MAKRSALVVATAVYDDPGLQRLRAPVRDAEALAHVLGDSAIGAFDVRLVKDQPEPRVRREVAAFFANRTPDDVLLLHFSCHGLKDAGGQLYFAATDTELESLDATALPSEFVNRQMTKSRSRRVVLLLDCCYSGAFARGMLSRADKSVDVGDQLGGQGRAVLTASSSMEYAFEGDALAQDAGMPSVFTSALVRGLETGEADSDFDGVVSVGELYNYVFEQVRRTNPNQTPRLWSFDLEGELVIANSPAPRPVDLPPQLQAALASPFPGARLDAVPELTRLVSGKHKGLAMAAEAALRRLREEDDSLRVRSAAAESIEQHGGMLESVDLTAPPDVTPSQAIAASPNHASELSASDAKPNPIEKAEARRYEAAPILELSPQELDFGTLKVGESPPPRAVRIHNAGGGDLHAKATSTQTWIRVEQASNEILVTVSPTAPGSLQGVVIVDSAGGRKLVRIQTEVKTLYSPDSPRHVQPRREDTGTAAQMKASFRRNLESQDTLPIERQETPLRQKTPRGKNNKLPAVGLIVVLLIAGIVGIASLMKGDGSSPSQPAGPGVTHVPSPDSSETLRIYTGKWEGTVVSDEGVRINLIVVLKAGQDGSLVGTTSYPNVPCNGRLRSTSISSQSAAFMEDIIAGKLCTDGVWNVRPTAEGKLEWSWPPSNGLPGGKGQLSRSS
jgi:Caspase domain